MKAIGGLLLVVGMIALLLSLILWLPADFSVVVVVLISVVCFGAIGGGGSLSQTMLDWIARVGKEEAERISLEGRCFCNVPDSGYSVFGKPF